VSQIDDGIDPVPGSLQEAVRPELLDRLEHAVWRLETLVDRLDGGVAASGLRPATARPVDLIEMRRAAFRPAVVRLLFLVSPMPNRDPPEITDFYLASGHLHRSIRAAFVVMMGEEQVPSGDAFLRYFMERGCWLVALPNLVGDDHGRPSNRARRAQREFVRQIIGATSPESLITITPRVTRLAAEVVRETGARIRSVESVAAPKDLWQKAFVPRLRAMVGDILPWPSAFDPGPSRARVELGRSVLTVLDVARVLDRNRNKRMRVYGIADELMADGTGYEADQVRSAVRRLLKQNRSAFDQNGAGIRMSGNYLAEVRNGGQGRP